MARTDVKKNSNAVHTKDPELFETPEHLLLTEIPSPPEEFNEDPIAIFWWTYYCGLMIECGTLSRLFIGTVRNVSKLASFIEQFELKVQEQGTFIDVVKKFNREEYIEEGPNPLIPDIRKMYGEMDRLLCSLGMTPFSSKINAMDATGTKGPNLSEPPSVDLSPPETLKFGG